MRRIALQALPVILVLAGVAIAAWHARPDPPPEEPEQPAAQDGDTGFSRQATEDRMRAIGYVQ